MSTPFAAEVAEAITALEPESGWWHSYIEDTLRETLPKLLGKGFTVEEAVDICEGLINATKGEYGD